MARYIDKDALIAEIERRMQEHHSGYLVCLKDILSFINTIETKDVESKNDIQLTWKDMRELHLIFGEIDSEIEFCRCDIQEETIGYYQEALKRFKALKGE